MDIISKFNSLFYTKQFNFKYLKKLVFVINYKGLHMSLTIRLFIEQAKMAQEEVKTASILFFTVCSDSFKI